MIFYIIINNLKKKFNNLNYNYDYSIKIIENSNKRFRWHGKLIAN